MLGEFPDRSLSVQVVWLPVLKSDVAPPLTGVLGLIKDPRVRQYWDPDRALSRDLVRSVNDAPARYGLDEALPPGFVAWDVVAVFGGSARWERDLPPPARYGGPVVREIDETRRAVEDALRDF